MEEVLRDPNADTAALESCIEPARETKFNVADPRLAPFRTQFENLPPSAKEGHTWEEVVTAMERGEQFNSVDEFLAGTSELENPSIYFVEGSKLIIGDGGDDVPKKTLGMNYFQAKGDADERGLDVIERDEWRRLQIVREGGTDRASMTWLKTEKADLAVGSAWNAYNTHVLLADADLRYPPRGVRRVLRVNLAFEP